MNFQIDPWIFCLVALAAFRLTRLFVFDKITEFIRRPFFNEVEEEIDGETEVFIVPKETGIRKWIGELLSCYWCTGIWVSIFLILLYYYTPNVAEPIIIVLAVAAVAAMIETVINWFLGN